MSNIFRKSYTRKAGSFRGKIFFYVLLGVGAFIIMFPLFWMVTTSVKTSSQAYQWPPAFFPNPATLRGYFEVFQIWNVPRYYLNTIIMSLGITVVCLFFSSLAGYAFAHLRFPFKEVVFIYIIASLMLPFQVRMVPTYLLLKQLGWLNTYQGLIIPWWATGFSVFLMRQAMTPIPRALFDAARIDGCSEFHIYWRIALPACIPSLVALGVLTFLTMWNELLWPLIVVLEEEMKTLPLLIASMAGGEMQQVPPWPVRMAGSTLVALPIILVYLSLQKYLMRALTLQAGIK